MSLTKVNMSKWRTKARAAGRFAMMQHLQMKRAQLGGIELNILDIDHVRVAIVGAVVPSAVVLCYPIMSWLSCAVLVCHVLFLCCAALS